MAVSHNHDWQQQTLAELAQTGLSDRQVIALRTQFGENTLPSKPLTSNLTFFLRQLASPLIIVLLVAAGFTALLNDWTDTGVILAAVLINSLLGFYQEKKAFTSLQSLKSVLTPEAWVVRESKRQKVVVKQIVPFDVVTLYEGDKVPADGVVVEAHDLFINEAMLTGESVSVEKQVVSEEILQTKVTELERLIQLLTKTDFNNGERVYMGTTVASGSGIVIVTTIGAKTEMGSIAAAISEEADEQTPLERRLQYLARNLAVLVILMTLLIFVYGAVTKRDLLEMFTVSVALAVSAIPEGLVIALTSILAIGMHRILKRKALVRNLVAAETLGTITTVCLDKTGTLTEGKLRVVATEFIDPKLGYRVSVLANEQRDSLELARWRWAESFVTAHQDLVPPHELVSQTQRDDLIPFSSERRFLATRHGTEISMMGAPDTLIHYCAASLSAPERKATTLRARSWAESGRRVIGAVQWKFKTHGEAKKAFVALRKNTVVTSGQWIGLMGFEDPVRPSVAHTLEVAERAGIAVKVITGDYKETAIAVLASVGRHVADAEVIEGYQLLDMSDQQLQEAVKKTVLFARTKPSQKLRIVKALKANNEIVAMMGDGVNDAPALSAANIGLVVGDATEVAQEVADIVLLDSNFETILAAIEEGRGIFANLRKVILYLLSDTFSEVVLVLGSMFLGLPVALTATQVLWINIIKEVLPSLALVLEPKEKSLLKQDPVDPKENLVNFEMKSLITLISATTGFGTLGMFAFLLPHVGLATAQSAAFALLSTASLLYIFSCRSLTKPFWHVSLVTHRPLFMAIAAAFGLTLLPIYFRPLQVVLGLAPLSLELWCMVIAIGVAIVGLIEGVKGIWKYLR